MHIAKRLLLIPLFTGLVGSGCQTTTSEARSPTKTLNSSLVKTTYQAGAPRITIIERIGDAKLKIIAKTPLACTAHFDDTNSITVTSATRLADGAREEAGDAVVGGAAVLAIGAVAVAVLSPIVLFDPKLKNADNEYVPVSEQSGFALWPIGFAVGVGSAVIGVPLVAAPAIVGALEKTETKEDVFHDARTERTPKCDKDEPSAGEAIRLAVGGDVQGLGGTDGAGSAVVDMRPIIDAALAARTPENKATIFIRRAASDDLALVIKFAADGRIEALVASLGGVNVPFPLTAFPSVAKFNAAREDELRADARARAMATEQARLAQAQAEQELIRAHAEAERAEREAAKRVQAAVATFKARRTKSIAANARPGGCILYECHVLASLDSSLDGLGVVPGSTVVGFCNKGLVISGDKALLQVEFQGIHRYLDSELVPNMSDEAYKSLFTRIMFSEADGPIADLQAPVAMARGSDSARKYEAAVNALEKFSAAFGVDPGFKLPLWGVITTGSLRIGQVRRLRPVEVSGTCELTGLKE